MNRVPSLLLLTTSVLAFTALNGRAQLIAYEGMNYPAGGSLATQNGGTGWTAAWTGGSGPLLSTISGTSLGYSDTFANVLATTGGSAVMQDATTTTTDNPQRATPGTFGTLAAANGAAPGTLWMSYLWQGLNTTGPLYRQASMMLLQNTSEFLDIGMPNISAANSNTVAPNLSLWGANGNIGGTLPATAPLQTTKAANDGSTLFLVMKMSIDATTASDTLTLWINPDLNSTPVPGTAALTFSGQNLTGISNIRLQSSAINATFGPVGGAQQVDEIFLGDTFTDVAPIFVGPEPGVLSIATLGGAIPLLAYLRRRIKRS